MKQTRSIGMGLAALAIIGVLADGCSGSTTNPGFGDQDSGSGLDATDDSVVATDGHGFDAHLGGDGAPTKEAGLTDGAIFNDGAPDVAQDACTFTADAGPAPYTQKCVTDTASECDGADDAALTALGIPASLLNGAGGNGFDDDCDGLVDEGCACPGNGQTKDCYLVPPSQIDPATKKPVGWCTDNSKGSLDCAGVEFPKWSGTCRGAQPPYAHDVCAPGDFNCDGLQQNSDTQDCACKLDLVACPTTPITEAPYPDPIAIQIIDGSLWITDPAQRPNATNWTWTIVGGDCDNVLPHPTFALYTGTNSTTAPRKGTRTPVKYDPIQVPPRYVALAGEPLIAIQAPNYGSGVAGGQAFPAFGLSGDYIVQGEWDLANKHYVCTQKVQVRAPGIRAELCWDTTGGDNNTNGNDIDLHLARLQGVTCPTKGWDTICSEGQTYEDCYYNSGSGCRDFSFTGPSWGYPDSANSACLGWSSKRDPNGTQKCTNPRLDKDNITCDPGIDDPTANSGFSGFCGPENINLDNPKDGDIFAIAVNHYATHGTTPNAHPHVNIYCNGDRKLSVGYNPVTNQLTNPLLNSTFGGDSTGDFWNVGTVTSHVTANVLTGCDIKTIPSHHADQTRDGATIPNTAGNQICVESVASQANPPFNYTTHVFVENVALQGAPAGTIPPTPAAWCKH